MDSLSSIFPLSNKQIEEFKKNGVIVIDKVLSKEELLEAREGLKKTMLKYKINEDDLQNTAHHLRNLSSTNGSGGVIDVFYPSWKMKLSQNPKFFSITSQLWDAMIINDPSFPSPITNSSSKFPKHQGFMYIDRVGYRIPTSISNEAGTAKSSSSKTNKKKRSLQRSLTPHLDCCPISIATGDYKKASKWRPFQSFVALSDTMEPNLGGFECVPGFHANFSNWALHERKPTLSKDNNHNNKLIPAPCLGEFSPIRTKEDQDVISQMKHIPCRAGSVVIWDNRIPHANSLYNYSNTNIRCVVYASFLPDINLNRSYVQRQLNSYKDKMKLTDQWIRPDATVEEEEDFEFSKLGRLLIGLDSWDDLDDLSVKQLFSTFCK